MADTPKDPKERWLNYVALSTVILAVAATLGTFLGNKFSTKAVLSQTQASDQWAYYQAKSIKGYLYEGRAEGMQMELDASGQALSPEQRAAREKKIAAYLANIARYEKEKSEIMAQAKALEDNRVTSQAHSATFGLAIIFLQIGILLSSISAFLKKKPVWLLSLAVGAVGCVYFANGFFMWF
jgi:hypothetical protein